jgi:hypothetical protein
LVSTEAGAGLLFEIGLLQLLSDKKADFTKLTNTVALYCQILDDYRSLCTQQVMSSLSNQYIYVTRVPKVDAMKVCVALICRPIHSRY